MSTLLKHRGILNALSLIGVDDPESDPFYIDLYELFNANQVKLEKHHKGDNDLGLSVVAVKSVYVYEVSGQGRRIVRFSITNRHDISQIFVFCKFMEGGVIKNHQSSLVITNETASFLIGVANVYIGECDDDKGDRRPF